ncbi:hypothetical protein GQ55_3G057200 [Panicum hallii var. hallii]|uniref:Uncharacterized protein n=1 Tax=Panicum hallii var. hallii TaxID=1504633 RepID=A0A2T7E641_9POAL|nr:hypothetical protein GQ55_3G057200 [Panicum hallii var. hallii]
MLRALACSTAQLSLPCSTAAMANSTHRRPPRHMSAMAEVAPSSRRASQAASGTKTPLCLFPFAHASTNLFSSLLPFYFFPPRCKSCKAFFFPLPPCSVLSTVTPSSIESH